EVRPQPAAVVARPHPVARGVSGQPYPGAVMDAIVRWLRDLQPATADGLLAVLLAIALGVLTPLTAAHHGYRHADLLAELLAVFASLTLAARRRAPLPTLLLTLALMAVYEARGYAGSAALLAPLVALYTVAVTESRALALALGVLTGVVLVAVRVSYTS